MAPRTKKNPAEAGAPTIEAPAETLAQPPAPPAPPKEKPLTNLQRVKLMNNLVAAVENEAVLAAFKGLNDGDKILDIFTNAVDAEVAKLMDGEGSEQNLKASDQVGQLLRQTAEGLARFHQIVSALSKSPIMEVLLRLHGGARPAAPQQQPPTRGPAADGPDVLHPEGAEGAPSRQTGRAPTYAIP